MIKHHDQLGGGTSSYSGGTNLDAETDCPAEFCFSCCFLFLESNMGLVHQIRFQTFLYPFQFII